MKNGIRVKTSSFNRHHINVTMCKAKANGNYLNSIMAHEEAVADGYDEALLLDVDGYVAKGPGENIFIIRNDKVYTPELTACLDGITRNTVIHIIKDMGLEFIEKRITRDEVYVADEVFFTGTAAEVTPIRELDHRPIGAGGCGPITAEIQKRYFNITQGRNDKYNHWCNLV